MEGNSSGCWSYFQTSDKMEQSQTDSWVLRRHESLFFSGIYRLPLYNCKKKKIFAQPFCENTIKTLTDLTEKKKQKVCLSGC